MTQSTARIVGKYPTGRVLVDGTGVGDIGAVVLRDRQILAEDGVIAVSVTVDARGAVVAGPEIASRGVIYVKENEALIEELKSAVLQALSERRGESVADRETVAARMRTAVRQLINQRFHRKPVVLPMIMEA
jgi:ribonuclease J